VSCTFLRDLTLLATLVGTEVAPATLLPEVLVLPEGCAVGGCVEAL
jgi:hypothetical protein